jgi:hypothetical protein
MRRNNASPLFPFFCDMLCLGRLFSRMSMFLPSEEDARVLCGGNGHDHGRARDADEEHHFHQELAYEDKSHSKSVLEQFP